MFCSVLDSRDALLGFGRLVWSVMDLMVLFFFCGCFWIIFSEKRQCWMVLFDLLQYQHQAAYFSFCVLRVQIRRDWIHYFQRSFDWGFRCLMRYQLISSVIRWIHGWGCCWGWWKFCSSLAFQDTLLGTVGLADLEMDQMVLFFFCDFLWGLGMLKRPETIVLWRHWFGRSLRPGKPSNSPRGAEDATMVRRAPFPLSSLPASIEHSIKLLCVRLLVCALGLGSLCERERECVCV